MLFCFLSYFTSTIFIHSLTYTSFCHQTEGSQSNARPKDYLKFWGTVVINCISFNSVRLENRSKKVKKYKPALSQTEETTQRIRAVTQIEDVLASWLHPRKKLGDVPMTSLFGAVAESDSDHVNKGCATSV